MCPYRSLVLGMLVSSALQAVAFPDHLQLISEILDSLNSCERRRLCYLCERMDADCGVASVKEMLKSKMMCQENAHLFLEELMWRLGRFDILKRVLKVSRDDVERSLTYRQLLPRFRVLVVNISEDLVISDLEDIKFLLSHTLSRERIENAKNFLDVMVELEKLDLVSPERVDIVKDCLTQIGRLDLAKKVATYKMSAGLPEQNLPQQNYRASPIRQGPSFRVARVNTPVYREQSCEAQLECYKFNTNPRGVCVIIDCVGNDGEMLEKTFKALHFSVILCKWLSADDTLSTLSERIRRRENHSGDAFVCCIISRGTANHLLGTDMVGRGLPMDAVRRLFTAEECPMLSGKPKIFFIQRYSAPQYMPCARVEHRDEDLETDAGDCHPICHSIPTDADVFWSHCWTDECQLEQGQHRSVYLKALTDALEKPQRRKTHLVDVHTQVNGVVFEHNKRHPDENYYIDVKHTLRKHLYLE
ncbi:CASP8 and FADD-like apoptosis regulator isoform X2 [Amphiprion ocellaris]|uniref:CASP8 and FADD-like apoptosis regulator isoform X2 n=1 Tax=Amphiprion ocellaris TaxID=80972 RepID=UPI002410C3F8|nr:CASP8 and FADD-like apoptosis regulator isoform X2 [Amphiprion ocellaris]